MNWVEWKKRTKHPWKMQQQQQQQQTYGICRCGVYVFACVREFIRYFRNCFDAEERELMVCSKVAHCKYSTQWDQRRLICCKMLPVAVILLNSFCLLACSQCSCSLVDWLYLPTNVHHFHLHLSFNIFHDLISNWNCNFHIAFAVIVVAVLIASEWVPNQLKLKVVLWWGYLIETTDKMQDEKQNTERDEERTKCELWKMA